MAEKKPASKHVDLQAFEASLAASARKLSEAVAQKRGTIRVRLTDSGEDFRLEGVGRELRMARSATTGTPLVEVSGPSPVIKAIIDGKKEASRAFIAGGLQVQGDLDYLEALLKDLGVLECGQ